MANLEESDAIWFLVISHGFPNALHIQAAEKDSGFGPKFESTIKAYAWTQSDVAVRAAQMLSQHSLDAHMIKSKALSLRTWQTCS